MSSSKLSGAIKTKILRILKKDLRKDLNKLVPELEINEEHTIKWLKRVYFSDLEPTEQTSKAKKAFKLIIMHIASKKNFTLKKGVAGKPYIFSPTGSKAVDKYNVLSNWKREVGGKLQEEFGVGEDFGSKFHLGHGQSSIPTVGYRHIKAAAMLVGSGAGEDMLVIMRENPLIKELQLMSDVSTVLNKDLKFSKKYTVRLKLELGVENLAASAKEKLDHKLQSKKLIDALEKIAVEGETSPSSIKTVSNAVSRQLRGKKAKNIKNKSRASNTYKNPKKGRRTKTGKMPPQPRTAGGQFTSAMNIQAILDQRIKQQVQDNMGEGGALVNRTGRFAQSVSVEKVMQSRQGTLTAFYTYMKAPYQTFERGFKQGSLRRDPRKLIAASIREIARETLNHKLQIRTRRV
jgi:hypothetical protein